MIGLGIFFPIVFSFIGFILAIVALFAGNTPGFMEEYQIILVNTSALGRNYVPALSQTTTTKLLMRDDRVPTIDVNENVNENGQHITSHVSLLGTEAANRTLSLRAEIETARLQKRKLTFAAGLGVLASLPASTAADDMAGVLGISQFFSLHALNVCEGGWSPNATTAGAWRNVSRCTAQLSASQLNVSRLLDQELGNTFEDGNAASLASLGVSDALQKALNRIPMLGLAVAVFFILSVAACGLCLLLPGAALLTGVRRTLPRQTALANLGASATATLTLLIAALVAAVGAPAAVSSINRLGLDTVGLQAANGTKFCNLAWAALAMMVIVDGYWARELYLMTKHGKPIPSKEG